MTVTATGKAVQGLHIGGEWTEASSGETFEDHDPFTGDVVASVPAGTREDARRAIEAAAKAFPGWSQTPPAQRQRIFLKAADILESRIEDTASWLTRETGATFGFAMFQLQFVAGLFRQAAALGYQPIGEIIPSDTGAFAMGIRRPVGVVGAMAPWNAALILSARSLSAPMALGNTVVLKPSELSPYSGGLMWGEIFSEAGLPEGVLNIVTHAPGDAGPIGDEFAENPLVRVINFTGSTETGRRIAEAAGRNLKRVVLELGGYNPLIVLADADLDYAVNASAVGAFMHQGQICMSARRIIVEEGVNAREIEVSVLGNEEPEVSVPGEIIVTGQEFYDYEAKYTEGGMALNAPASLPEDAVKEVHRIARTAYTAIDAAGMARVDFFLERGTGRVLLNEINTIPGFTPTSVYPKLWAASGLPYEELLDRLIRLAFERHGASS